jgi:hypothetical protein
VYAAFNEIYQPEAMPPYKFEIHVFHTLQDFIRGGSAYDPPFQEWWGGVFSPHCMAIFVYEDSIKRAGEEYSVEHMLAHECSHQFLYVACNGSRTVPTWINEGLAVYFEAGVAQGNRFVTRAPKGRIDILKKFYDSKKSTMFPLEKYLSHYGHITPEQYGEVYAITHFWLFGTGPSGLDHFRDYWKRLKNGEDGTKAFDETFMKGMIKAKGSREAALKAWEQAYFEYVKNNLP